MSFINRLYVATKHLEHCSRAHDQSSGDHCLRVQPKWNLSGNCVPFAVELLQRSLGGGRASTIAGEKTICRTHIATTWLISPQSERASHMRSLGHHSGAREQINEGPKFVLREHVPSCRERDSFVGSTSPCASMDSTLPSRILCKWSQCRKINDVGEFKEVSFIKADARFSA